MRLLSFAGYRYTPLAHDPPGWLAAPPFDQIDEALRDELHQLSPYHYSHLTRPVGATAIEAHEDARETFSSWLSDGRVVREEGPSLYVYTIRRPGGGLRHGLCCLVDVRAEHADDLRPHERTVDKPLEDRLSLLEATRIDLEPVLLMAEDDGSLDAMLVEDASGSPPLARHLDPATEEEHSIVRIADRDRIRRYQKLLADRGAVIADGHHRTKVAQLFAQRHSPAADSAAAGKLAVLTSLASDELRIDPIHRGLVDPLDVDAARGALAGCTPIDIDSGAAIARAVEECNRTAPTVGFMTGAHQAELWTLDPGRASAALPPAQSQLAVALLHDTALSAAGLTAESTRDGTISYRSDPDRLYDEVREGSLWGGLWLPGMAPQAFADATMAGDVLPPKSTRFLPKLVSGLVWCGHDAAVD